MANQPLAKFNKLKAEAQALLAEDQVAFDGGQVRPVWQGFAQFCVRVGRSFVRNRCPVRAAALAYTTVLALVPVLGVAISISAGLLKSESGKIEQWIENGVHTVAPMLGLSEGTEENASLQRVTTAITEYVENFRSGGLGVTAVLALIFVAISLLSSIEATLNDIWGVPRGRRWAARIVQYWAVISLGPLLFLAATGLTTTSQLPFFKQVLDTLTFLKPLVKFGFTYFVPFVITGMALGALYLLLPNTKVHWSAAMVGGGVAGALVQLNSTFNVLYASRVAQEKSLYGGLAAVPLFMLGLYLSWLIVLLGAQVAYAYQNRRAYVQEKLAENINQRGREFVALRLMTCLGERFQTHAPAPAALEMADTFGVPLRLVMQVLGALTQAKLVIELAGPEATFAPARPLDRITAHDVLHALRALPGSDLATSPDAARRVVQEEFAQIEEAERGAAERITLAAMVNRATEARGA